MGCSRGKEWNGTFPDTGDSAGEIAFRAALPQPSSHPRGRSDQAPMNWLEWTRRIQAIAQAGLTYTEGPFDRERYHALQRIAAEMLAEHTGMDPVRSLGLFAGESGYPTPKVDVRGVVFRDDRLLLVREREDGLWTLPGGWADVGESPREAVEKEIREETGYHTRAVKLLAVWDRDRHGAPPLPWYVYKLAIRCELVGGEAADSIETEAAGFFAEDEIPPLSRGRIMPGQIARIFEHHRHPEWPTEFD
jgi:ADP-ribose pyrophosphatase YjhB (NUDIX family)